MRRLTASKFHIALNCAFFLRDDAEWIDRKNTYSKVGSASHRVSDEVNNGILPDVSEIAEDLELTDGEAEKLGWIVPRFAEWYGKQDTTGWKSEVKLAWDPLSGEAIKIRSKKPRDYSQLKDTLAVCGTADLAYGREDAAHDLIACTDDYKTGWGRGVDPFDQGSMLTFMHAKTTGAARGRFRVITLSDNDEPRIRPYDFAPSDLRDVESKIRDVVRRALGDPKPNDGAWCRWCPARATCPASQAAAEGAVALVPEHALARKFKLARKPENVTHAAWTLNAIALARAVLDEAEQGVRAFSDEHGGIPLGDGNVFRKWETSTRQLELNDAAISILEREGLGKAISREPHSTIGAIQRVAGKSNAQRIFDQLEAAGAITYKPGAKYEARTEPQKGRAA
jgi:hypothetical protein